MNHLVRIYFPIIVLFVLFQTGLAQEIIYESYRDKGKLAFSNENYSDAEKFFELALSEAEKLNDVELIAIASTNLGKVLHTQGKFEKAENLYLRSVDIYDSLDGENQERAAFALNNLGLLYTEQKEFEKAEKTLRKTITIREKLLGKDAPDVGISLLNLGKLYADQSKYSEANAVYVRSLEILIQNPELVDEILICLHNISQASFELKEFKRAEAAYKMQIAIIEKQYGKYSKSLISPLENYAIFLRNLKRNNEAILIERRCNILKKAK